MNHPLWKAGVAAMFCTGLVACGASTEDRAGSGAAIGAGTGAAIGALAGGVGAIPGALIGAAVGGGTGAATNQQQIDLGQPVRDRKVSEIPPAKPANANSGAQSDASVATTPQAAPPLVASDASSARSMSPRSDAQIEGHINRLHDSLKITPAQSDQWDAVARIMRDNEHQMSALIQKRRASGRMSAVDDLRGYQEITDMHVDGMKKLVPAFQKLYDSMSDAQKKTADNLFNQRIRARTALTKPTKPAKSPNG